ncbi:GGDEF domain-containing protein [Pseudoxanthomonas sp. PXM05]|jgi:diguanylate cyclase (GGDEF)-like protein|uniref:GGDEF domain-containing protein n=1 Tax=Pseudoxanthomonas sp. PXM05 TaxID=2854775 RepID=UPI001C466358|nr:GGDEF domain-containing protein [Pseudoxanthomonas sp. PXM05]MBV7472433.1 GGDEF domain-containing protein [Pseudoxanthomonas sp. PXM05]
MSWAVLLTLLSDCLLAVVLFVLFWYVARVSRNIQGAFTWGAAHLVYTIGATLFDAGTATFADAGLATAAALSTHLGSAVLCGGMAALGWAVVQFARRRALHRLEIAVVPMAVAPPLLVWGLGGGWEAQSVVLNCVELLVLLWMIWHLHVLREDPYRLPARMMMLGCGLLAVLYGSVVPGWSLSHFGFDEIWVSVDLSIWFMLNFCMLMLCSFRAAESLKLSAMFDPLTGALNRRGLHGELSSWPDRDQPGLSVIAIDLDHFKAINDRHGHDTGDRVLQRFSETVRSGLRSDQLFARMGGEEFAVVMPGTDRETARHLSERLRNQMMRLEFSPPEGRPFRVTISLGIAFGGSDGEPFVELMRRADDALYAAKRKGRNRVEMQP